MIHRVVPRPAEKPWKCGQFAVRKMRQFCFAGPCPDLSEALDSLLHRARSASRSKPLPRAVGGSRRFTGEVDESATGSVNYGPTPFDCTARFANLCGPNGIPRKLRQPL